MQGIHHILLIQFLLKVLLIKIIHFLLNHCIGKNVITLGKCGSGIYTTHLVKKKKKIPSGETNIKIALELIKSINPLTNMKNKKILGLLTQSSATSSTSVEDNSHLR